MLISFVILVGLFPNDQNDSERDRELKITVFDNISSF